MKERPILFSAPMVRALLNGSKTQTRRLVKPQPEAHQHIARHLGDGNWQFVPDVHILADCVSTLRCPYGQPGDRLWVRETFVQGFTSDPMTGRLIQFDDGHNKLPKTTWYRATDAHICWEDGDGWETSVPWKPSIRMPRWASRITLEITGVRVELLHDISDADAIAEGCALECMTPTGDDNGSAIHGPGGYMSLWESINGPGSWDANPWVWVVEFKRVTP